MNPQEKAAELEAAHPDSLDVESLNLEEIVLATIKSHRTLHESTICQGS